MWPQNDYTLYSVEVLYFARLDFKKTFWKLWTPRCPDLFSGVWVL